jgi:hypothetical protein
MLLRRREEREQALQAEAFQRQQLAAQMQTQRSEVEDNTPPQDFSPQEVDFEPPTVTPEVLTEPGVETMANSEADGYTQLAEYLDKSLSEGKNAGKIVGELKMALVMGMFSRDTLNELLAEDFDVLVERVSAIKPSLRSPKSRKALKTVMDGMRT